MTKNIIEIRDLSYKYPDGTTALDKITLDVAEHETIALVGSNGAGKTTMLLHLNGILYGEGDIIVNGIKVDKNSAGEVRTQIGLVFQEPDNQLFCPTVFDDVAFGPINMGFKNEELQGIVKKSLEFVELQGYEEKSPHHLSFGEKKRVALAAVIAMNPRILAFDEPSSNLDPHMRRKFIETIKTLNTTNIIATHDLELVLEVCSRTAVINKGRIVAFDGTRKILSDEKLMFDNGLEVPLSIRL